MNESPHDNTKDDAGNATLPPPESRVRVVRKLLGLSQWELARTLGVAKRTIARWEAGESEPHEVYVERLEQLVEAGAREHDTMMEVTHGDGT
ncbi:MAG TPA: helix-turn-helix transcriptional regulator [Nitrospira sp.]|nr:helix-turn-helix transcriptional regulator [Nitrospira sp.]